MSWDENGDFIPEVKKEDVKETEITKEDLIKRWKQYYEMLDLMYPIKNFKIQGKNGEDLCFYHGSRINTGFQLYCLREEGYEEAFERAKENNLLGKENSEKFSGEISKTKAYVSIDKEEKVFNFGVEFEYHCMGYGEAIYDNYLNILDMLGIEDKEKYELRVGGNPNHEFFKSMATKKIVKKTNTAPDSEIALEILKEFSEYANPMTFSNLNKIIKYAIDSNISTEEIAKAINDNGFKIYYDTFDGVPVFNENDINQFKLFGISGLKPTCMHEHFERTRSFGFMKLLDNADEKDATLEFRRIFEEIKKEHEENKNNDEYVPEALEKYGELEYIILYWNCSGLLFKNVSSDIKEIVKEQAINNFENFDPERIHEWGFQVDSESYSTMKMLKDAGFTDIDTYIALYQKALNRNYSLEDFDSLAKYFFEEEIRDQAKQEIAQNIYCPSPKNGWQKSGWGGEYRIKRVKVPENIINNESVRNSVKQKIVDDGVAKRTKIKTDMVGTDKDGKHFTVDNLKDWLFGVPGAHGNLTINGKNEIVLPPQTPKKVIEVISQALNELEHPDIDER